MDIDAPVLVVITRETCVPYLLVVFRRNAAGINNGQPGFTVEEQCHRIDPFQRIDDDTYQVTVGFGLVVPTLDEKPSLIAI